MDWLPLSLLCAFSLATADASTKVWLRGYSARELALVRFSITGLILSPILLAQPLPPLPAALWPWLLAMIPLEVAAMLLYMRAIQDHALSLTLPYLAFTPVFVILTGFFLLGETINGKGLLGIFLVVGGAWLLNMEQAQVLHWRSWANPILAIGQQTGARLMLGVALIYSFTAVLGKGAMQYMEPTTFGPLYFVFLGLVTTILFGFKKPRILLDIWRRPGPVLLIALLMGVMVVTHFLALQMIEVAYMISVKRTSLLFGILYGALLFHEPRLGKHLLAGGVMLTGVFLLA